VDAIGESRGVHRATAARWVKRAHARLVRGVRAALQERLAMTDATYESVVRLIASRLELTLERYLGAP
jgi:RNA polymerase sigma-70 factor (ECF subfamily)